MMLFQVVIMTDTAPVDRPAGAPEIATTQLPHDKASIS
jgi:hypothetical protein